MDLRLLLQSSESAPSYNSDTLAPSILIDGRLWHLSNSLDISNPSSIPPFTCVSFTWGPGRVPNPFHPGRIMSDRTIPALTAAMRHHFHPETQDGGHSAGFWIDALCIPDTQPSRRATLESMGFVYSRASVVTVSLSGPLATILHHMTSNTNYTLSEDELQIAERDEWVTSVWTYQEIVNSQTLFFIAISDEDDHANGATGVFLGLGVPGSRFLNCVGHSLSLYKRHHNFDVQKGFPRLDALEDVTVNWLTADAFARSALKVMSNLDRRVCASNRPENRFYSMIGAITQSPKDRVFPASSGPSSKPMIPDIAESFMGICEAKGDYSFIFSSAERDNAVGRRWRPKAGFIPAILPWDCHGDGLRGHYDKHGFWLDNVYRIDAFASTTLGDAGRQIVLGWLRLSGSPASDADITNKSAGRLKQIGFTGSSKSITTPHGIFFPQNTIQRNANTRSECIIIIPATLQRVFGYPALARIKTSGGSEGFSFVAGVFVGSAPNAAASSVLIDPTAHSHTSA